MSRRCSFQQSSMRKRTMLLLIARMSSRPSVSTAFLMFNTTGYTLRPSETGMRIIASSGIAAFFSAMSLSIGMVLWMMVSIRRRCVTSMFSQSLASSSSILPFAYSSSVKPGSTESADITYSENSSYGIPSDFSRRMCAMSCIMFITSISTLSPESALRLLV